MIGADYSTKFSPWLAHGCISPRYIYAECQKYEREREKNKSTYWIGFELTCRDYFRFFSLKHGNSIFMVGGPAQRSWRWESNANDEKFQRWVRGETGQPLVDANMRELALTGFMSNRGRQNVASYLTQNLNVDWRLGAAYFEDVLIDHDVTANWANWNAAAGVSGGRINKFNILKQSKDYDEQGEYCHLWCPELANVPSPKVHLPWTLSDAEQSEYRVTVLPYKSAASPDIGPTYPTPLQEVQDRRGDNSSRTQGSGYSLDGGEGSRGKGGERGEGCGTRNRKSNSGNSHRPDELEAHKGGYT
mmetsp:Transcript_2430/g.3907  ORF Transcript_2430/g.3907 Transcript_2430/m.3907 type:complete len:303 (+) Transcript_2430:208-1116(+)